MSIEMNQGPSPARKSKHCIGRRFTAEDITRHANKLRAHHHAVLSASLEMPMKKIGEHLNIPIGTVKSRLHRARLRLDDLMVAEERRNASKF